MHHPNRVAFLLAIAIASLAAVPAHAVQFTYLSGTHVSGQVAANAYSAAYDTNGPQSGSTSDSTFSIGPHVIGEIARSQTPYGDGYTHADAAFDAGGYYYNDYFQVLSSMSAYGYAPFIGDTVDGSASTAQTVKFQVDTTGIYRLSGYFAHNTDADVSGSVSFSTGYLYFDDPSRPPAGDEEYYEQLFSLQAGMTYELDVQTATDFGSNIGLLGTFEFIGIPEPSTACLLTFGTLGACRMCRRRRVALLLR